MMLTCKIWGLKAFFPIIKMGVRHPAAINGMGIFFPTIWIRQMMFLDLFVCKINTEYSEKMSPNLQRPRRTSQGNEHHIYLNGTLSVRSGHGPKSSAERTGKGVLFCFFFSGIRVLNCPWCAGADKTEGPRENYSWSHMRNQGAHRERGTLGLYFWLKLSADAWKQQVSQGLSMSMTATCT